MPAIAELLVACRNIEGSCKIVYTDGEPIDLRDMVIKAATEWMQMLADNDNVHKELREYKSFIQSLAEEKMEQPAALIVGRVQGFLMKMWAKYDDKRKVKDG
jgi:hypothetical protein